MQKTTGTLSQGAHPGSYNGQDAYNDMLITDAIFNSEDRRIQEVGPGKHDSREGLQECDRSNNRGGYQLNELSTSRNKVLCILRKAYGEEATFKWGVAILDALQQAEVLRQGVYEGSVSSKAENRNELDDDAPLCPTIIAEWLLRDMRKQQECGCSPYRWESKEQRFIKLNESVPELPYSHTPSPQDLFNMWEKGEGLWLLYEALSTIQEIRRSLDGGKGGDGMNDVRTTVRRLTPL